MGETIRFRRGPAFDTDGNLASAAPADFETVALGVEPLGEDLAQGPGRDGLATGHKLYLPLSCPVQPGMEALVRGLWLQVRSVSSWRSPRGTDLGGIVAHAGHREG